MNPIGTYLAMYGESREDRKWNENLENYRIITTKKDPFDTIGEKGKTNLIEWELTAIIPFKSFYRGDMELIRSGKLQVLANFYKCGDELPVQFFGTHFLTQPNKSNGPDFHQPQFFQPLKLNFN